jgi:hypothetical protein
MSRDVPQGVWPVLRGNRTRESSRWRAPAPGATSLATLLPEAGSGARHHNPPDALEMVQRTADWLARAWPQNVGFQRLTNRNQTSQAVGAAPWCKFCGAVNERYKLFCRLDL